MFDKDLAVAHRFSVENGLTIVHLLNITHQDIDLTEQTYLGQFYTVRNVPSDFYKPVDSLVAQVSLPSPSCHIPDVHMGTPSEVEVVHAPLQEKCDVFNTNSTYLGITVLIKHDIHTSPVSQRAYIHTSPVL